MQPPGGARTAALVPRVAAAMGRGDDALLRELIAIFEEWDLAVVGVEAIRPDLIPGAGVLAGDPSAADRADAARAAEILPYGPPRRSAQAMVGNFLGDGTTPMGPHLPTASRNMTNALFVDPAFWADHETELRARFTAWLGSE